MTRSRDHFSTQTQQYFPLFIVVGLDVTVNNLEVLSAPTEVQQWVPFALLYCLHTFCTVVENRLYTYRRGIHVKCPILLSDLDQIYSISIYFP